MTVLADATVEKHSVDLPADVDDERISRASTHLAAQLTGTMRGTVPATVDRSGDPETDLVVAAVLEVLRRTSPADSAEEVFVGGASRVASAFDAVETVQRVLSVLEEQLVVVTLLRDVVDRGLQVAIGTETGMETLADAALVVAPYTVDGERAGSIGVLGPARMNYPEAMAAVAAVSRSLGHHLTEGGPERH